MGCLRSANRRRRNDDRNESGRHVIDKAGDKPAGRQRGNRAEHSNVADNGGAGVRNRFRLEFAILNLKIVREHPRFAGEASHAAISVLHQDDVKLAAASRDLASNLTDSVEQTQLFQQPGRNSAADVPQHDGLARFDSEDMTRIRTHIGATDDDRLYIRHRPRKRGQKRASSKLLRSEVFVPL
jgi:hypothetical protein